MRAVADDLGTHLTGSKIVKSDELNSAIQSLIA